MKSVAEDIVPLVLKSETKEFSRLQRSIWAFWILLSFNLLSLPGFLLTNYFVDFESMNSIVDYVQQFFNHTLETQIFLLAFWLSFGGVPERWRALSVFAIVALLGFGIGVGIVGIAVLKKEPIDPEFPLAAVVLMIPLFVMAALWMINAVFVIPAWFFGMQIGFPILDDGASSLTSLRTFGISQLFSWTAQVALPLGLLNAMVILDGGSEAMTYWSLAPFAAVLFTCTPLLIALLMPTLSVASITFSLGWAGLIAVSFWMLPLSWEASIFFKPAPVVVNLLIVVANCAALRWMGFRWRTRSAPERSPHA